MKYSYLIRVILQIHFLLLSLLCSSQDLHKVTDHLKEEARFEAIDELGLDQQFLYRAEDIQLSEDEMLIDLNQWCLAGPEHLDPLVMKAVDVFRRDISIGFGIELNPLIKNYNLDKVGKRKPIYITTIDHSPQFIHVDLDKSKDYRVIISSDSIVICGYDEKGAMHELYYLLWTFRLKSGPICGKNVDIVRSSQHLERMTLSGLGWMDWPDPYLESLAKYGFDCIYASVYANADGSIAPKVYKGFRTQSVGRLNDLIYRASLYGIDVFVPLLFEIRNDGTDSLRLEGQIKSILDSSPYIKGFVLLTEGFMFGQLPSWDRDSIAEEKWIDLWVKNVNNAANIIKRENPSIQVLAWDYSIDFRAENIGPKRDIILSYNRNVTPLITWENGKTILSGKRNDYVNDYSISVIGPSEVAEAQISTAKSSNKKIYAKADTWASWQFGTFPYLPAPYQWQKRYDSMLSYGVDGVLESWTYGFKPNFVAELRYWNSWSSVENYNLILEQIAKRDFGKLSASRVLKAWELVSEGITNLPETGPYMTTNTALAAPLFFNKSLPAAATFEQSVMVPGLWAGNIFINPYWPYMPYWGFIMPNFENEHNYVEAYTSPYEVDSFLKKLMEVDSIFDLALNEYKNSINLIPISKRDIAFKEINLFCLMKCMIVSAQNVLEYYLKRYQYIMECDVKLKKRLLGELKTLLKTEYENIRLATEHLKKDSRIGFNWYYDYLFTPEILELKIKRIKSVLDEEIPAEEDRLDKRVSMPTIISGPLKRMHDKQARFTFEQSRDELFCRLNHKEWKECRNPHVIRKLDEGLQIIEFQYKDNCGSDSEITQYTWFVE